MCLETTNNQGRISVDPLRQHGLSASRRAGLPVSREQNPCHNERKFKRRKKVNIKEKSGDKAEQQWSLG
jgi:hypothetical protein